MSEVHTCSKPDGSKAGTALARISREECPACSAALAAYHNPNTPITMAIPSPDSGVDSATSDTIARLTRERDEARAEAADLRKQATRWEEWWREKFLYASEMRRERDETRAEVTRLRGVVHTYMTSHDEQIAQERLALIGQAVRERDTARRWSRLWHAEARRLWREVQALSEEIDP